MLNECLDLINTKIDVKVEDKTLTENLKVWRKDRNITRADYLVFVGNILEELLEPIWSKNVIEINKQEILDNYFNNTYKLLDSKLIINDIIDAIQDIQVFCINETELMGYDNLKCNNEVFSEINSREQNPIQKEQWEKFGSFGKWEKSLLSEHTEKWYKADYNKCKLLT